MRKFRDEPVFKMMVVLALAILVQIAYGGPSQLVLAQEGTPYPTEVCMFDPEGNWVCFSGTNDLTPTPTVIVTGSGPDEPLATPPILTPFVPTQVSTSMPTPSLTPTVVIQPANVCTIAFCLYLPIGAN